jgi:putative ABC transport system permease protein
MFISVIEQALIALPLILGAYLTLSLLKLPDFSLESAYLFGAVGAYLFPDFPLISGCLGGMVVGSVVTFFNQVLHIPFLLAAIVINGLFHGLTQYFLGTSIASFHLTFPMDELGFLSLIGASLIILLKFFLRSELGFSLAIFGNNPNFFQNHPISGRYVVFFGVTLGHGLAGISGFLFAQSNGFVDLTMNFGILLLCLTALMAGKLLFRLHRPNILVPILGILAYFLLQQSLLRIGLNLKYFNAFQALFVLFILFIGQRKQKISLDHLGV